MLECLERASPCPREVERKVGHRGQARPNNGTGILSAPLKRYHTVVQKLSEAVMKRSARSFLTWIGLPVRVLEPHGPNREIRTNSATLYQANLDQSELLDFALPFHPVIFAFVLKIRLIHEHNDVRHTITSHKYSETRLRYESRD